MRVYGYVTSHQSSDVTRDADVGVWVCLWVCDESSVVRVVRRDADVCVSMDIQRVVIQDADTRPNDRRRVVASAVVVGRIDARAHRSRWRSRAR